MRRGPTPFRFENMWLKEEGFKEVLRKWWEGIQVNGLKLRNRMLGILVDFWDKEESARSLSMEEEEARKEAKETYKKWVLLEEASWRQKSREIWLKEGDRNTRGWKIWMWKGWRSLSRRRRSLVEVMNFFRQFHESWSFVRSLNATFLVLIPKKRGVEDLKDFRPISLVGGLYKWLTKVLANRLKVVVKSESGKSELIPVGRVENVEELAEEFGYKVGRLPST
ncbi:hypothetical protein AAG906_025795 [Vitis piasezkii]